MEIKLRKVVPERPQMRSGATAESGLSLWHGDEPEGGRGVLDAQHLVSGGWSAVGRIGAADLGKNFIARGRGRIIGEEEEGQGDDKKSKEMLQGLIKETHDGVESLGCDAFVYEENGTKE
ncbi:hypothetical protein GOBAR_DD22598 [Gossypium barbadense]|nr:hypothetical protein GOBAR_DD22598 [Gossypium barbadense]